MIKKLLAPAAYLASIVGVNVLFATWPELSWLWAVIVGGIFVTRDYAQKAIGHWVLAVMALAGLLTWFMASPFIAIASLSAFAVAELVDWAVYSFTKKAFGERVLISSALSVPLDSAVFLLVAGFFSWPVFLMQIAAKMLVAGYIWARLSCKLGHDFRTVPCNNEYSYSAWCAECSRCGAETSHRSSLVG
jgi:queuosine precursor transporter